MSETKKFHQVSAPVYAADGLTVEYGPGELHEPGSLPEHVPYVEVLADEAQVAGAPTHMKSADPVAEDAAKRAEFQRIQTERSGPAPAEAAQESLEAQPGQAQPGQPSQPAQQQPPAQPGTPPASPPQKGTSGRA